MKQFIKQLSHGWILLYFIFYLIWFFYLNQISADSFHAVEISLDKFIPFNEWFIIPYYLWFPYIPLTIAYFFLTSREEYYRICMFLFIGMTICLITYSLYPTGVYFRPDLNSLGKDNFLIDLTRFIYTIDPGTNVCPSLHCFNAIGVAIAILKCDRLNKKKWFTTSVIVLSTLICMSTVLVKQHSIIDFFFSVLLSIIMYCIAYVPKYDHLFAKIRLKRELVEYLPFNIRSMKSKKIIN